MAVTLARSASADGCRMIHNHKHDETYERQLTSALCFARAFETESLWVMCNAGGDELQGFMGGSGVWAPFRGRVDGMDYAKEDLKVVDVDLRVLKVRLTPSSILPSNHLQALLTMKRMAETGTRSERIIARDKRREMPCRV